MGSENAPIPSIGAERARGIEECECPAGYAGLSCEECAFGYARIPPLPPLPTGGGGGLLGQCVACQCNGHAASCLPTDLTNCSLPCLHNTIGDQCQHCAVGYYGDARTAMVDACRQCQCPLPIESNNFSPTCHADGVAGVGDSYVCDRCPPGYKGNHCEM